MLCCDVLSDFFDFGVNQGDATLAKDREKLSKMFKVPAGLPIADETFTRVAVSTVVVVVVVVVVLLLLLLLLLLKQTQS